jgi:hypothetical protein
MCLFFRLLLEGRQLEKVPSPNQAADHLDALAVSIADPHRLEIQKCPGEAKSLLDAKSLRDWCDS